MYTGNIIFLVNMTSKTYGLLVERLPPPIADIAHSYFKFVGVECDDYTSGFLGDWEGCFDLGEECRDGCLEGACAGGHIELAAELIRAGEWHLNRALWNACMANDPAMVELLIAHGARDFDYGMISACENGVEAMVKMMRDYGACEYDAGLRAACYGGSCALAEQMIDMGATEFGMGLREACVNGRHETAAYMISLGVPHDDLNKGMDLAAENGHMSMMKMLEDAGGDSFYHVFMEGAGQGNLDMIKYAVSKGVTDFSGGARVAALRGRLAALEYMYEHKPTMKIKRIVYDIGYCGYWDMVPWIERIGFVDSEYALLSGACAAGQCEFVNKALDTEWIARPRELSDLFAYACEGLSDRDDEEITPELTDEYADLMRLLIEYGAEGECTCGRLLVDHVAPKQTSSYAWTA
jgi:hypothetical protein